MSTSNPPSLIERLPIELWERIFLFTSARDILRLSLVNHACHSLVRDSLSIQYEIDLYAAGLKRNPRTEASLSDCRSALAAYRKRWETLDPAEKWDEVFHAPTIRQAISVSGTCGVLSKNSVRFFTLGSASRGISRRVWDVSLEDLEAKIFTFYPQANIMAVVEGLLWTWIIHLRTLSDGGPHPAARKAVLSHTFAPTFAPEGGSSVEILDISITGSRLAVLRGISDTRIIQVVVWDWTTGQILLELENEFYQSAKFVDDYWLAFVLTSCEPVAPRLMLLNTEQTTADGTTPVHTTFHFDPREHLDLEVIHFYLDLGGYKPSPEDSFAPFYPDASERVLVVELGECDFIFVMKTEVLLKLAREQGSVDLQWEQWKAYAVTVQPGGNPALWVSGSRLFCIYWAGLDGGETWMDVYEFSAQASARNAGVKVGEGGRIQGDVQWPSIQHCLPWDGSAVRFSKGGHDSIAFFMESEGGDDPFEIMLHVWEF